jgi:hypothetical protein
MLKTSHDGLIALIAQVFTDILHGKMDVPAQWCISRLVVLFKKGDSTLPINYRPIAIIPVLSKLFSSILLGRIIGPEQGGFRPDHSCSDIIMFMRMVAEKAEEWGEELWAASLDLEKAFDKVDHSSVLNALGEAGVEPDIVRFLWQVYRQQSAYVSLEGNVKSRLFQLLRGVRQGDPMSPALFNNVTRKVFDDLKQKWSRKGLGTIVCGGSVVEKTTHAMFADDTTLFASSRSSLIAMIKDVKSALAEHGLNLNLDKCLVQTSRANVRIHPIEIDGQCIPMVDSSDGFKVLGTMFTLQGRCSMEVKARIAAAWGKFHALWPVLGKRDGDLRKRLRLFDACVSQSALWCCESWLITKKEKDLLKSTQNNMLRRIAGPRRAPDESWVEWVKRSTRRAVAEAKQTGIRMWVDAHLKSKWCWAGHAIRMAEGRLARRGLEWRDSVWWTTEVLLFSGQLRLRRPMRTHWFRWEDDLKRYAAICGWASWQSVAQLRDEFGHASKWLQHCEAFVKYTRK